MGQQVSGYPVLGIRSASLLQAASFRRRGARPASLRNATDFRLCILRTESGVSSSGVSSSSPASDSYFSVFSIRNGERGITYEREVSRTVIFRSELRAVSQQCSVGSWRAI